MMESYWMNSAARLLQLDSKIGAPAWSSITQYKRAYPSSYQNVHRCGVCISSKYTWLCFTVSLTEQFESKLFFTNVYFAPWNNRNKQWNIGAGFHQTVYLRKKQNMLTFSNWLTRDQMGTLEAWILKIF